MRLRGHVLFGARIVSVPGPRSPLRQLGLRVGDVITRLDGIPFSSLNDYDELEDHFGPTYVRYIRSGTSTVREGLVHLGWHPVIPDDDVVTP